VFNRDQPNGLFSIYAVLPMPHNGTKPIPALRKAPQPPLSSTGATPDSDRAKKPPLSEPAGTDQELKPGDRVAELGNFGKPTGEFGKVERSNQEDAVVKWDGDGRKRLSQNSLKKV
jgi:hypothetical protein